jgi:hypothetical protein
MRILLAIVAFLIAAPLLSFGLANSYFFISENMGFGLEAMFTMWPFMAMLGVVLLLGFAFLAAGIAMLTIKPRAKQ